MTVEQKTNKIISIWQKFGPDSYPVDLHILVEKIINECSGNDRLNLEIHPLGKIDGALINSDENPNSFTAFVNSEISNEGRRRFTLAHEIGHFVLHRDIQKEFSCNYFDRTELQKDGLEKEANKFASQILMPPNRIREYDNRTWNFETLKDVAERFNVSLQAAGLQVVKKSSRKIAFVVSTSDVVEWGISSSRLFSDGVFFKQLDSVPCASSAYGHEFSSERLDTHFIKKNIWKIGESFKESSMLGYDGKIYTCIDVT